MAHPITAWFILDMMYKLRKCYNYLTIEYIWVYKVLEGVEIKCMNTPIDQCSTTQVTPISAEWWFKLVTTDLFTTYIWSITFAINKGSKTCLHAENISETWLRLYLYRGKRTAIYLFTTVRNVFLTLSETLL